MFKWILLLSLGLLCQSKENVIFEQIGELAGATSYLHAHITISLFSIHQQIEAYKNTLTTNFADVNSITRFINESLHEHSSKPPEVMEYAAHQWGLIAKMHEKDLHDLEEHALALRNILPDVPLSPHEKNRIDNLPTSTTRRTRPLFNQQAPSTTKAPVNIREASKQPDLTIREAIHPVDDDLRNSTINLAAMKKLDQTDLNIIKVSQAFSPTKTTPPPKLYWPDHLDHLPIRKKRFAGIIALPIAIAATAMGIYNTVQIEFLKNELLQVQENARRLFEVVSHHDEEIKGLYAAIRGVSEILTGTLAQNPVMLDARLSRIENQIRDRLRMATHAIQTGQHRRLAVDYLSPNHIRKLFKSLQN